MLALDRSGSMAGSPLANMKAGAKTFIDIIDEATDGGKDGQIGFGSRVGIVSFADTATANTQLITSVDALKLAVDDLDAGGSTNHAAAFTKAMDLFDPSSSNAKVIVLFTDGKTTTGTPPAPVAAQAKAKGISELTGTCTAQEGTIWYTDCLPQVEGAQIMAQSESAPAMIMAVESGTVDFICTDMPTAMGACATYSDLAILDFSNSEDNFKVDEGQINIGISVVKGNTELKDAMDKVLAPLNADIFNAIMNQAIAVQPTI